MKNRKGYRKIRILDYEYQPTPYGDIQKLRNVLASTLRTPTAVVQLSMGKNLCAFLVITKTKFTFIDGFHLKYTKAATFKVANFILSLFGKEAINVDQKVETNAIMHDFSVGKKSVAESAMSGMCEAIAAEIEDKLFTKAEVSVPFNSPT